MWQDGRPAGYFHSAGEVCFLLVHSLNSWFLSPPPMTDFHFPRTRHHLAMPASLWSHLQCGIPCRYHQAKSAGKQDEISSYF